MYTSTHKHFQTRILLTFFSLITFISWSQGFEDFTNSSAGSSYSNNSFTGNNSITWTYVESRNANGDANSAGINLPALMLRRSSDDSKVTSSTILNGIGNFSVKLYKGFTGSGDRQVELFVNGTSYGTSTPFDDFDAHLFEVNNINESGGVIIEIKNITSKQVIVDNITWTSFGGGGANASPFIANIEQIPSNNNVTSSDNVLVSADIVDADGIASAEVHWGTTSGNLSNSIGMILDTGDSYSTTSAIPAHADGTIVYYEIEATDNNATPLTITSSEQSYTVKDPIPFSIPYVNGLRDQNDLDEAIDFGFEFNNTTLKTSAGGYMKIENGSIVSPAIDFSAYDVLSVSFDMSTFGGDNEQELSILVSNDNGSTYTSIENFLTPSNYLTFEYTIDLSSLNGTNGRIKFEMTGGSSSIRFRDFSIYRQFVYSNGAWTPFNPDGVALNTDDLRIADGTAVLSINNSVNNITINTGASLEIEGILTIAGDITNDGDMVFKSTATSDGELAAVPASSTITGVFTVERYTSANRAYRFVSSPVTTSTSIHDNWQEGATSATDNPAPGFGTHITGSTTDQQNGFDGTVTGNPSLFRLDAVNQSFVAVTNTNVNTVNAGEGYLLFVRGDRSIDLGSNDSHSSTTLRTKGILFTGTFTENSLVNNVQGEFNLIANPYQSAVNINTVIADSQNLNSIFAYVYDPTLGTNGTYVTITLSNGSNTAGSYANGFLQPGQSLQVATANDGPTSIVFNENAKAPGNHTSTFKNTKPAVENPQIIGQLFITENYTAGGVTHDSFGIYFSEELSNEVTQDDAVKPFNFTENLGIVNGEEILSIERRALPVEEEEIQFFSNNYNHSDYTLLLNIEQMQDINVFLKDNYTQAEVPLENGDNVYAFSVSQEIEASLSSDRFSIYFAEDGLTVENATLNYGIELYPNPTKPGDAFYMTTGSFEGDGVQVSITDIFGKRVYQAEQEFSNTKVSIKPENPLSSGVYFVQVSQNGKKVVKRLMIR
ncbi:T9SS type A sorting domain-containing protein [Mesonia sp. MT50]|uniref:T9SS type A sorting domain-containing protein n=1 Tax=Mesonia profundi TaxID=3070998 RepID=A0ABU0ZYQ3_9FLAO|nr:T9SS type A sorting domain-containing protein [Mesonia profundi]MDQ7916597.1 T9SS type A sorting domain-containing protein [Mesonia profundi]